MRQIPNRVELPKVFFFCFALFGEKFVNQSFRVSVSDTGFLKQYVVSNVKLSVKGLSRPPPKNPITFAASAI